MSVDLTTCSGCKKKITAEEVKKKQVVSLLNRLWHKEHVQCVMCKLPIPDGRIFESHEKQFQMVCYPCHIESSNPPCTACGLAIHDRAVVALDRPYHVDCLRCAGCDRPIARNAVYYLRDMFIYDADCFVLNAKDDQ